jgi:hypothetical protein
MPCYMSTNIMDFAKRQVLFASLWGTGFAVLPAPPLGVNLRIVRFWGISSPRRWSWASVRQRTFGPSRPPFFLVARARLNCEVELKVKSGLRPTAGRKLPTNTAAFQATALKLQRELWTVRGARKSAMNSNDSCGSKSRVFKNRRFWGSAKRTCKRRRSDCDASGNCRPSFSKP